MDDNDPRLQSALGILRMNYEFGIFVEWLKGSRETAISGFTGWADTISPEELRRTAGYIAAVDEIIALIGGNSLDSNVNSGRAERIGSSQPVEKTEGTY